MKDGGASLEPMFQGFLFLFALRAGRGGGFTNQVVVGCHYEGVATAQWSQYNRPPVWLGEALH